MEELEEKEMSESSNNSQLEDRTHFKNIDTPNILNPDDNLMKRFQKTLETHLLKVDNRLTEEILNLEATIKQKQADLETESLKLYQTQQETEHQQTTLEQFKHALEKLTNLREKKDNSIEVAKDFHRKTKSKLDSEKEKKSILNRELEKLEKQQSRFLEWEEELNNFISVSKRISKRDLVKRKELIDCKQRKDYIVGKLQEEVWRIETEIAYLDEQLQIKNKEKGDAGRMIIDANTDLEALYKQKKDLCDMWNSVVASICKRDSVYEQLQCEREEARKSYNEILHEIEKIKKETDKEMETNENLTSFSYRVENNVRVQSKLINSENERVTNIESQLINVIKLKDQIQNDFSATSIQYQKCLHEDGRINREIDTYASKKTQLESLIFSKLESKLIHDKAAKHINQLLLSSKESLLESELSLARSENVYGNSLLDLEKLKNVLEEERKEIEEIIEKNVQKERKIEKIKKEVTKMGTMGERERGKLLRINRYIEQLIPSVGGDVISPNDLKILSLEKCIQDLQQDIQKAQQFWMRLQGFMTSLSHQRETQINELNLLCKEIMIMEQRNLKLEYELEALEKEKLTIDRTFNNLEKTLGKMNKEMMERKDLKEILEDRNCIVRGESILEFRQAEIELIKLQASLKELNSEKEVLREELSRAQQESLSWEKKVQLTQETIKKLKEERTAGGISLMKSEIHKMEMRLSHLRRVQEKLIHDMEFCVARRDIIVDRAIGRMKRNPKEEHNKSVINRKRIKDQKVKIKQLTKGTKQIDNAIEQLQIQMKEVLNKLIECQENLTVTRQSIPNLEKEIEELEEVKYHNLQSLVFKQRKAKLLRDINSGRYKMMIKSESIIEENLQQEEICRNYLKDVMEKVNRDFPMLKTNVRRILLVLQNA